MTDLTTEPNVEFDNGCLHENPKFGESLYEDPDFDSFAKTLDKNLSKQQHKNEHRRRQAAQALRERILKIRNGEYDIQPLSGKEIDKTRKILEGINNPVPTVYEAPTLWIAPPNLWEKISNWFKKFSLTTKTKV